MPLVSKSFSDIITFSRGSNATYFDSAGVLKYAPNNAIRNNTGVGAVAGTPGTLPTNWTAQNVGGVALTEVVGTGTEDGIAYVDVRYTGTTSSTASGGVLAEQGLQIAALPGQTWVSSVFVRLIAGNLTNITSVANSIFERDSGGVLVAQTNATFTPTGAALSTQRFFATRTLSNASTVFVQSRITITPVSGAAIDITLRIGLPQLEIGDTAGPAIPTSGTAYYGPRFDYNPSTLAAQGLLIEEQRTNLLTYSEAFDNAAWAQLNLNTTGTPAWVDVAVAPNGTTTADFIIPDTTLGQHRIRQDSSITSGTVYSNSIYFKAAGYDWIYIQLSTGFDGGGQLYRNVNIANGTLGSGTLGANDVTVAPVNNGWYRVNITRTATATTTGRINWLVQNADGATASFAGNGTSGVYIWGAQLEAGAFPTSYIPTTTTALTRAADVASVNTLSPWFNASEGTLFAEGTPINVTTTQPILFRFDDGSNNNTLNAALGTSVQFSSRTGGSSAASVDLGTPTADTTGKVAGAYKASDFAGAYDGTAADETSGTEIVPVVTLVRLGASNTATANTWLRRITYYPRRLSNAELQAITS